MNPVSRLGTSGSDNADHGRQLVHSLRNCLSALKYGTDALERLRTDEDEFKVVLVAMRNKLDHLEGDVALAAQRLEDPPNQDAQNQQRLSG